MPGVKTHAIVAAALKSLEARKTQFDEHGRSIIFEGEWAGGVFGAAIQVGFDIKIKIFPNVPWTSAKLFFFDGLAAIVGADLTPYQQGVAFRQLIEGINNDYDHDEGGWLAVHTKAVNA